MQGHRVVFTFRKPERIFLDCCAAAMLASTTAIDHVLLAQKYTWSFGFRCLCGGVKVVEHIVDHIAIAVAIFARTPRPMFTSRIAYRGPGEAIGHTHTTMCTQGAVITTHGVWAESVLEGAKDGG